MLVLFTNMCVTKQVMKPSMMRGGQPEVVTEIVEGKTMAGYVNPDHVISLDIHPSGYTVISLLGGGRLIADNVDKVARKLNKAEGYVESHDDGKADARDLPPAPANDEADTTPRFDRFSVAERGIIYRAIGHFDENVKLDLADTSCIAALQDELKSGPVDPANDES